MCSLEENLLSRMSPFDSNAAVYQCVKTFTYYLKCNYLNSNFYRLR